MAKTDTVLFDFDGTVMNTNDVIIASWQHTFRTIDGKEREVSEIARTFGEPIVKTMKRLFPQVPVEESLKIYRSYQYDYFDDLVTLFPGMKELLVKLRKTGYKTGLVTSRMRNTTYRGLEKFELTDLFDAVVTCDDTSVHKPDPEPVFIALEKLGTKPEKTVMLGDTMYDIMCANNAGVTSVLVGWAIAPTEEEIKGENGPDFIMKDAADLFRILDEIG
ncbi:MAG: HAD-IA family hydrolase [Firmicutes bacterium]|nr:HAD-IA family hydrolase [Bacillota bacterium]